VGGEKAVKVGEGVVVNVEVYDVGVAAFIDSGVIEGVGRPPTASEETFDKLLLCETIADGTGLKSGLMVGVGKLEIGGVGSARTGRQALIRRSQTLPTKILQIIR
jgi:hypothetical protein